MSRKADRQVGKGSGKDRGSLCSQVTCATDMGEQDQEGRKQGEARSAVPSSFSFCLSRNAQGPDLPLCNWRLLEVGRFSDHTLWCAGVTSGSLLRGHS